MARGSCLAKKDIDARIVKFEATLHKLDTIWKSININNRIKVDFFRATDESVLLYEFNTMDINKGARGNNQITHYTEMLRAIKA